MADIGDCKKVHCTKIAMVYTKQPDRDQQFFGSPTNRKNVAGQFGSPKKVAGQFGSPKNVAGQFGSPNDNDIRQRKISHNFMHEKKLLDALDMIAVIPVP